MSVGTVVHANRKWVLRLKPHIAIKAKRVFGGVRAHHVGPIELSDTPEVARDLEWFLDRYPLEMDPIVRAYLQQRADKFREQTSLVEALLSGRIKPMPFALAIPPRSYQAEAASMALTTRGLLLADDVGLGKTCSAICTFTDDGVLPILVVTLTHLQRQWQREIARFAPTLSTHIAKTGKPYDLTRIDGRRAIGALPDVIIMNYHKLAGWAETLSGVVRGVVYDECQDLRKHESYKYAAARVISDAAGFRMGLSATPIYNFGGEMFNVMQCLSPGALGTREEFSIEWGGVMIGDPQAFGHYLRERGMMLRRTRRDVGRELPDLQRITHYVEADAKALDAVSMSARELAKIILTQGESERGQKMRASEELSNMLRQATGIAKAPYVAAFVRVLVESGEKVVLYGWHRAVYDIWLDLLKDLKPVMYTGSESAAAKDQSKAAFVDGDSKIIIVSLRAGAGLDGLQFASRTLVFGEIDWSPGVHVQCEGRVHRDGQPEPVASYFLLSDEGSDPVIAETLGLKRQQSDGVLEPEKDLVEQLQVDPDKIRRLAQAWLDRQAGVTA